MKKKNNKQTLSSILILILVVILTYIAIDYLGLIEHKLKPTGIVETFDVDFGEDEECETNEECDKSSNTSSVINYVEEEPDGLRVFDGDTQFTHNTKLNIFTQTSYYVVDDRIAPGSKNSYEFIINNNNSFGIKYNLEMTETNIYNVNMKYRLKLNGEYIVGNDNEYVSVNQLNQYNVNLQSGSSNNYILDWKWFESSNDTEVGTSIDAKYQLDLNIFATQN